jgi:lysophospholipase L1-like esterase
MSFIPYANEYAEGRLDVVYVLLGWNDVHREAYPYPSMMADCKTFIDTLHTEFPSAKVKLMGLQVCSINGGMGANYGATGSAYADTFGTIRKLMALNQAYKDFAESSAYSSFVEYVDIASQFDSENNMPSAETKVNTRSSMTERRGTNGVHPSTDGYMQIADVVYRNIIANL